MEQNKRSADHPADDNEYSSGSYFEDLDRHSEDAAFKVDAFRKLAEPLVTKLGLTNRSQSLRYADVGCGSGAVTRGVHGALSESGLNPESHGYDLHKGVESLNTDDSGVEFHCESFIESDTHFDLVTVFDVFEHVPDPLSFLKAVAARCDIVAAHIPLDDTWANAVRNSFRHKLSHPGHILFMNPQAALNVMAFSGVRVVDYEYTTTFMAPSGHRSLLSKVWLPVRAVCFRLNPYLLSRTLGGVSMMVVGFTETGYDKYYSALESA